MNSPAETEKDGDCEVRVRAARVSNFRCLQNVEVALDEMTVLVGANNAGKTSFLDALSVAIGASRRASGKSDVYVSDAAEPPKERVAIIDVLIRPASSAGLPIDNFPAGSFWTNLWGTGISQDHEFRDFVGIRTKLVWNAYQGEYTISRKFLKEWKLFPDWLNTEEKENVLASQTEPIAFHYIDAKRDLDDDLRKAGSFWRRLTDDLGLDAEKVAEIEDALSAINEKIVTGSEVLNHLQKHLSGLRSVVSADDSGIEISPVARGLRDLSRGVDVSFSTSKSQAFPLARHGMGTRSLASLLVFRAFVAWRKKQAENTREKTHPLLGLEEPEAHLHPQAQRSLFSQIRSIPGQRIISTHSPYFAGQASLDDLRLFTKVGPQTSAASLDTSTLDAKERKQLERMVISLRGDLLFARAILLAEGETEEQALPVFCEAAFKSSIHELGLCVIGIGGGGHYFPFVWLAQQLGISWYVFSDGEAETVSRLRGALGKVGISDLTKEENIVVLPNQNNFERQLLDEGYAPQMERAIAELKGSAFLNDFITDLNGTPAKKRKGVQGIRDYDGVEGRKRAIYDLVSENKTLLASEVAAQIVSISDESKRIPECVSKLLAKISSKLQLDGER